MNREEKLKLSAEAEYGYAFRQGLFAKLYEQSLWRFVHRVRPLKPMRERVKGGRDVIYGGLPVKSFEAFMEAGGPLAGAEITEYGWRWAWPADEAAEVPPYEQWRNEAETAAVKAVSAGRDILTEVAAFNLAIHSPMEVMNKVLDWQEFLRKEVSS